MSSRIFLLGIPIDSFSKEESVSRIKALLSSDSQSHVATPNSEMMVKSFKDSAFHELLCNTAINLPDSAGMLFAAKWTGQKLIERVPGVDTVKLLCKDLNPSTPIFLLGASDGVAEKTAAILIDENPNLRVCGVFGGSPRSDDAEKIIDIINKAKPSLLLVAYGAPAQDFWIHEYLPCMPSVRVAMGVGGTFDFISGKIRRAPKLFQKLGLEWLWRVILEPRRIGRIFNAVVIFPFLIVLRGRQI